ncbi:MAG: hypothetical protein IJ306_09570 [Oscillospiraceae bacterium]|nr:hypothetical protein [Oscillospiraceae bacterium]
MHRAEILYAPEIVICEISFCIQSAAGEKHISDAVLESFSECDFKIQFIQILKKTVFFVIFQSFNVIGHIVFNRIFCGR